MTITAAVIGVGNMGKNHARVYTELPGVRLVAVADLNETLGREVAEKHSCAFYKDHRQMLAQEKPQCVSVCVPTTHHPAVALDVIAAGSNVLVEKPLALTAVAAEPILAAAKSKGVILTVGHIERFNPGVKKLKELIASGTLGDIITMSAKRVGLPPSQITDMDVVTDLAVHDIDVMCDLLGEVPQAVHASGGKAFSKKEDYADILLRFTKASGLVSVNWATPVKIRELSVTGTQGHAVLNYITQHLQLYKASVEKTPDTFGDFVIRFGAPEAVDIPVEKEEPLRLELLHFTGCCKSHTQPAVTGEDAIRALVVVEQVLASIRGENEQQ